MLGQQLLEPGGVDVLLMAEHQPQHVAVVAVAIQVRVDAEALDPAQVELALLAQEPAVQPPTRSPPKAVP